MMNYRRLFSAYPEVEIAYLFGSRARGNYSPISDYDFAVQLQESIKPRYYVDIKLSLISVLCRALKTDEIDVVVLNEAPLLLKHRIIKDKRLLFCRSQLKRVRLEFQILIQYLDFKEYEVAFSRKVFERILEAA